MLGHEPTTHETNSAGVVAICECGWCGHVHVGDWAGNAARAEHSRHLLALRRDMVASIDPRASTALASLRHRGRFGHA